jgi:uncharacterized protein (DUF1501 family)/mono/diheme cytochrome c family protein
MVKNLKTFVILLSIAAACQFVITSGAASEESASGLTVDFARDVRPIFERNCFGCHGAERAMSQLRLDVKRLAMKGGQSGAVVIPGDSKASLLMRRVLGLGGEQQMPLGKEPLKTEQIEILRRWIDEGAVWPEGESGEAEVREIELPKHWAYVKPVRLQLPSVKDSKWVRNPIDRFILSRLGKEGLRPSPEADKSMLIRRLSLDLTGLPPTLKEIDDFLADTSPRVYEKLVELLLASPQYGERWGRFAKHGQSGAEMSEALAHLPKVADQITIIKSMMTDAINHAPAQIFMQTGSMQFGRPSFGSWVTYGLGSEARDLPAFVVLSSAGGTSGGSSLWGSGFLPTVFQGVAFRRGGDPILSLANPRGVSREMQRDSLDALKDLNEHLLERAGDAEIATRINSFEMAYRMQESAPDLMDLSKETKATLELYGADPGKNTYANNCLLARRLVERGVRFVQLYHEAWDHHGQVHKGVKEQCKETDQANTALLLDLKQRGLLDDTIVIWGGEFGRTPMVQGEPDGSNALGRDHHNKAFTMWLAGGGFKPGITIGETDELGFNVAQDPVHVHDLHATILHLLGFDHTKLIYRFQGRDFRLTDVHGVVVDKALA